MSKSYIPIGEYSKMVGVSPEYLKFYDKKDLIKPVWKDDRSYRYYADFQIVHFMELQQLNNMGISLEESRDIIKKYSLEERLQVYKKAYLSKQKELAQLEFLMAQMTDTTDALEKISNNESWRIESLPTSYFVYHNIKDEIRDSAIWKDSFSMNLSRYIKMTASDCFELTPDNHSILWGAIQPYLTESIKNDDKVIIIPIGNCKCFVYEYSVKTDYDDEGKLSDKVWDLSMPLHILKTNKISHKGEIFQKRFCTTQEKDGEYLHVQLIVPLKD